MPLKRTFVRSFLPWLGLTTIVLLTGSFIYLSTIALSSVEFPKINFQQLAEDIIQQENVSSQKHQVVRVIDGDTIEIENGLKVRYIGIDTPETKDPHEPVGCYGHEAYLKNQELVANKQVTLEKDVSETDRYGRLLRYVYVDGIMVNEQLVKEGFAKAVSYPPDIKHQDLFSNAERLAQYKKAGLWGEACN